MEQYRRIQSCKVRTQTHFLITDNRKFVTDGCDLLIMDLTVIQKLDDQVITRLWRIQFEQFADQILAFAFEKLFCNFLVPVINSQLAFL